MEQHEEYGQLPEVVSRDEHGFESDPGDVHLDEEDAEDWYKNTFSSELEGLNLSIHNDDDVEEDGGTSSLNDSGRRGTAHSVTRRSSSPTKDVQLLQNKLQEAIDYAHKEAREKLALQRRLAALENLEDLRLESRHNSVVAANGDPRLRQLDDSMSVSSAQEPPVFGTVESQPWDRDEDCHACFRCKSGFSFTNRRHHCRNCGHIFCESCAPSKNKAPIPRLGFREPVRHCVMCLGGRGSPQRSRGVSTPARSPSRPAMRRPVSEKRHSVATGSSTLEAGFRDQVVALGGSTISSIKEYTTGFIRGAPGTGEEGDALVINGESHDAWIDRIRQLERRVSRNPTESGILGVINTYRSAIENLCSIDGEHTKRARKILVENMHSFLELPDVKQCLSRSDKVNKQMALRARQASEASDPGVGEGAVKESVEEMSGKEETAGGMTETAGGMTETAGGMTETAGGKEDAAGGKETHANPTIALETSSESGRNDEQAVLDNPTTPHTVTTPDA